MSTIGIVQGTDVQSVSRTTINDNFTNLNTDKADKVIGLQQFGSTTSAQLNGVISDSLGEGALLFGNALDFYKYSIVRTVDGSGNLTVALKNFEGNDPTATKPVKIQIGGVIRTITSALSTNFNAGTNNLNLGSAELATKEVDLFLYAGYDTTSSSIKMLWSRIPYANTKADFTWSFTSEKGIGGDVGTNVSTDTVQNIGRFNATLSAGAGYTWSIPTTSIIINSPIYETRWLDIAPQLTWTGTAPTGTPTANYRYKVSGTSVKIDYSSYNWTPGTGVTGLTATIPFFANQLWKSNFQISTNSELNLSGGYTWQAIIEGKCSSVAVERFWIASEYGI